jgi:hypothetical protein
MRVERIPILLMCLTHRLDHFNSNTLLPIIIIIIIKRNSNEPLKHTIPL